MKVEDAQKLYTALNLLDGEQKSVTVKGQQDVILVPYQFAGKVSWNMVKNKNILKRIIEDFQETNNKLVREISGGKESIDQENPEQVKKLRDELDKILKIDEDVKGLLKIKYSELNLNVNRIPVSVLELLSPIVEDDSEESGK